METAYIYPISSRFKGKNFNPYVLDFIDSFSTYFLFVNKDNPTSSGFIQVIKYIFKIDYVFLHWIEELPDKKGGAFQSIFLLIFFSLAKILNIKIVWTMHNKISHSQSNIKLKTYIFKKLLKKADIIFTHSTEGIAYAKGLSSFGTKKVFFRHHPVKPDPEIDFEQKKEFDLFLWGSIAPYKGIEEFVSYLSENKLYQVRVLIAGRFSSDEFYKKLKNYPDTDCTYINSYISYTELKEYSKKSKYTLFTYTGKSVLSSGALMDSLSIGSYVIGPEKGAFKDLGDDGVINTFKEYYEILAYVENYESLDKNKLSMNIQNFNLENSWNKYAEWGHNLISKKDNT